MFKYTFETNNGRTKAKAFTHFYRPSFPIDEAEVSVFAKNEYEALAKAKGARKAENYVLISVEEVGMKDEDDKSLYDGPPPIHATENNDSFIKGVSCRCNKIFTRCQHNKN